MKKQNSIRNFLLLALLIVGAAATGATAQIKVPNVKIIVPLPEWKSIATSNDYNQITLGITNWNVFSDDLFAPAPDLPPCGENKSAPRTWLEVRDLKDDSVIWTHCGIKKPSDLKSFTANVIKTGTPPCIYVTLNDRKNNKILKSPYPLKTDGSKEKCEDKK